MVWRFFGAISFVFVSFLALGFASRITYFLVSARHTGDHHHCEWEEPETCVQHMLLFLCCAIGRWLSGFLGRGIRTQKSCIENKCHPFIIVVVNIFIMKMIEIILSPNPIKDITIYTSVWTRPIQLAAYAPFNGPLTTSFWPFDPVVNRPVKAIH